MSECDSPYLYRYIFPSVGEDKYCSKEAYWPIVVIVIVVFLVWSEYGSQDCRSQQCNNKAETIDPNDDYRTSIDKIILTIKRNHTIVGWRRSLLVAIFATLLILMWMCRTTMVHGFIFFLIAVMIFFATYFVSAWLQWTWFTNNDLKIEKYLRELRTKLKEI